MARKLSRFVEWLRGDQALAAFLVMFLIDFFVGFPLSAVGALGERVVDAIYVLLLATAVLAVSRSREQVVVFGLCALPVAVVRYIHRPDSPHDLTLLDAALGIIVTITIIATLLRQVFRSGPITTHRILGSIAVYLLIGGLFLHTYRALLVFIPDAIQANQQPIRPVDIGPTINYFSFTTLSTLGFGDVLPVHPLARALATLEALIGMLYPTLLIARLINLQTADDHRHSRPP